MRTTRFGLCLAVVGILMASSAWAQGGGGGRGGMRGGGMAVTSVAGIPAAALEAPLALTADQKTKIAAIQTKMAEDRRGLFTGGGGGGDRQAMMQKMTELTDKAKTDIEALLTADQKAKVPDVVKKFAGIAAVGIPLACYVDLKLTDDQLAKIEPIGKDLVAKQAAAQAAGGGGGGGMGGNPELRQARTDARDKVQAILTDVQKKVITDYQAANPGFGGRRGGGGGG